MVEHRSSAQIIDFSRFRETHGGAAADDMNRQVAARVLENEDSKNEDVRTSLDDLYGSIESDSGSQLVRIARSILNECARRMSAAIIADRAGNPVDADLECSRVFAVWPELFLCRSISGGFGPSVLGIYYTYENLAGELFTSEQLDKLAASVEFLAENPFLTLDQSLGLLDGLEDAGLCVEPPEAAALGAILVHES